MKYIKYTLPLVAWVCVYFIWDFCWPHIEANGENWRSFYWFVTALVSTWAIVIGSVLMAL